MQRPLLYTYRRCPYAMRARMALLQAGVAFDAHEIVLRDKPADLLEKSPKGTVPVLVLPDGQIVDESLDIMRWAFVGRDPEGWWERAQSAACRAFVECNDGPFKRYLDGYKYPERCLSGDGPVSCRDEAMTCLLHPLDRQLTGQAFLGGDAPCAADLAIFPFVRQFRAVDGGWFDAQDLAATQGWLRGWLESELFERCMKKLPVGVTLDFLTRAALEELSPKRGGWQRRDCKDAHCTGWLAAGFSPTLDATPLSADTFAKACSPPMD